ncbi:MAG: DNA polymerase III subunit alpha [Gammaproteobacteria bacterium]
MTSQSTFIHLRNHSEFSMVDGILRHKPLIKRCGELDYPAIAMTDQSNLCGLVKFYRAAIAGGVKPIIGVDAWIQDSEISDAVTRVVFLCQNETGYRNLTRLISRSYTEGQKQGKAIIQFAWLHQWSEGLIVLSGGREGLIGQSLLNNQMEVASQSLGRCKALFADRFYLEVQRTGRAQEEDYIHQIVAMANGSNTAIVATNDVHFLLEEDFEAHEARICIGMGRTLDDPRRPKLYSDQQYLKSAEEMQALFADLPEALENTVEIAKRCTVELELGKNSLPEYPVPDGMTIAEFLEQESRQGLEKRLKQLYSDEEIATHRQEYEERLQVELDVINNMGFPGYFLIVADFIQWAKNNQVPVGPGRGSGAGSLVAYALEITDLDPLEYGLLFERFLNPERISMPDFDVDFCMDGRDRVIDYVAQKYGRDAVSQIITFGTMAAKAVVRDVGRVMGHPFGFTDSIAKLIPFEIGITLDKAFEKEDKIRERYENEEEFRDLWDMALKLEGITRQAGKHAGGVVISPTVLTDFTPIYCDESGDNLVCQFDKDDVESVGLVKFDFLGLRTLTIIDWAIESIQLLEGSDSKLDINSLPLDDKASYQLLKEANTTAVFQLESPGMKKLIKKLAPSRFEDIVALVALYRPGPLGSGMDVDFVNRKHGREQVSYPHPDLEECLESTYGVILYQEQVMQIAQILAGYSLGGADMLRRAMGKKKIEVMQEQRQIFVDGALKRDIPEQQSNQIFDLMEKFAEYGFNKSHSAAYALVAYQTAWLKAHYPTAFMAAVMSADLDNTDKIVSYIDDCQHNGLEIIPPDINRGHYRFVPFDEQKIIYGIGALKGVGESAIESIVEGRQDAPYKNLYDFCQRVDLKRVNKRVLEALIKGGAMDSFGQPRAVLFESLADAIACADQKARDQEQGMVDMFGGPSGENTIEERYVDVREWTDEHRLRCEKETLGLYLTGHPINRYLPEINKLGLRRLKQVTATGRGKTIRVAALLIEQRIRKTKSGASWASITVDDRSGRISGNLYSENYQKFGHLLSKDKVYLFEGEVNYDEYADGLSMTIQNVMDFVHLREKSSQYIRLTCPQDASEDFIEHLSSVLEPYRDGGVRLRLAYTNSVADCELDLSQEWAIEPTDECLERLQEVVDQVEVIYS